MAKPDAMSAVTLQRLIVTRPEAQAQKFCELASELNIDAVALPVLEIHAVDTQAQKQAIKNIVLALDEIDAAIFVSQNAVEHAFDWIEDYWPQLPQGLSYFGIGAKTEQAIRNRLSPFGEQAALSKNTSAAMDSEALLAHPAFAEVKDKKIIIFRGCGGRTKLYEELATRGAKVSHCELYERTVPRNAAATILSTKINVSSDLCLVFSGESLQNLAKLMQDSKIAQWQECHLVVPGERVAEIAKTMQFKHVHVAENASEESMLNAAKPLVLKQQ